jgi:glycosyltransferase involved in cell wall biosynthesis
MPFFSVIIPSYNRYWSLKHAIDSVLSQSFKDFELIVVDDGSTDGTAAVACEYKNKIIFIRQENKGVSAARNLGVSLSGAPYITFLDSDDVWMQDKLEAHANYIKNNPDIQVHQTDELWVRNGKVVNPMKKHAKIEGNIFIPSLDLCLVSPSAVVLRRSLFDSVGMFDDKMPACEDYDLWLRIGWREKIGLIGKKLLIKNGGHYDQLSKKYWGMDRFRIYSIIKLLSGYRDVILPEYRIAAERSAKDKCRILLMGAHKRGKSEFVCLLNDTIKSIDEGNYSSIDAQSLLIE